MNKIHVAVSSPSFSSSAVLMSELRQLPIQVHANEDGTRFDESGLIDFIKETHAEILIIGLESLTENVIKKCPSLKAVCKYGVGIDNLDLEAMNSAGLFLGWTPGVNKRSVSELVLSYTFGHFRNVFSSIQNMQKGKWIKNGGRQISDLKVGIVGLGNIGFELALLFKGFGSKVFACDILDKQKEAEFLNVELMAYEDLISQCDLISFHVPRTLLTKGMYGLEQIKKTKKEALICNTSRGDIVDFYAVCEAVEKGNLGGFAADVFPHEPFDASKLSGNLYFTPHIGGNSRESILLMGRAALKHVQAYLEKGK